MNDVLNKTVKKITLGIILIIYVYGLSGGQQTPDSANKEDSLTTNANNKIKPMDCITWPYCDADTNYDLSDKKQGYFKQLDAPLKFESDAKANEGTWKKKV